jgi:hypothetical protein
VAQAAGDGEAGDALAAASLGMRRRRRRSQEEMASIAEREREGALGVDHGNGVLFSFY